MNAPVRRLGLALPSKGRWLDLFLTLAATSLRAPKGLHCKFYVCADYPKLQLFALRLLFSSRATFIDERALERRGMAGAYNYAYGHAVSDGCEWVALWADDLLPERRDWLSDLFRAIAAPGFRFGIFSSDEGGHKGYFGWNVFAGFPCAHFYVARSDTLPGHMLNPRIKAYVGDNEICVSVVKHGVAIDFLPIRVIHQPTANATRTGNTPNYLPDLATFYELHPELAGRLDAIVLRGDVENSECRFIADEGKASRHGQNALPLRVQEFRARTTPVRQSGLVGVIGSMRIFWNETVGGLVARAMIVIRR